MITSTISEGVVGLQAQTHALHPSIGLHKPTREPEPTVSIISIQFQFFCKYSIWIPYTSVHYLFTSIHIHTNLYSNTV